MKRLEIALPLPKTSHEIVVSYRRNTGFGVDIE